MSQFTVTKRRLRDTAFGAIVGLGIGWLLQQGNRSLETDLYIGWLLAFAMVVAVLFYIASPYILEHSRTMTEVESVSADLNVQTASSDENASPSIHVSYYGLSLTVFFILAWLIPMSLTGAAQANLYHIPAPIRNQYRISCLFTHASTAWDTAHFEVRLVGQLRWQEGPLEGYFDLDIFGYRSRFNRILLASKAKNKAGQVYGQNKIRLEEMATFIAHRWAELNPEDAPVQEVRFKRVRHKTGEEHCMKREAWSRPPLSSIPLAKQELIHTVRIEDAN